MNSPAKHKKISSFLLKGIFTFLLLLVIVNKIDIQAILTTFATPNLKYLFASILLCIPNFIIKFYKWHYLLNACKIKTDLFTASKSYLAGLAFGIVTPARAGEIGRALFLNRQDKLRTAGAVIIDKVFDLIGILVLSLIGTRIFLDRSIFLLLVILILIGVTALLASKSIKRKLEPFMSKSRIGNKLIKMLSAFENLSIPVMIICMILALIMFFVVLMQCYTLTMTFYNLPLSFNIIIFAFPLVILANILPITIGGLGVRESVAVFCLSIFDVPGEVAFTATLYLFIINVLIPSLLGYIIILQKK